MPFVAVSIDLFKDIEFQFSLFEVSTLGAIQIIRNTFLAYFRPPPPHVSFRDTGTDPPSPV